MSAWNLTFDLHSYDCERTITCFYDVQYVDILTNIIAN